MRNGATAKARPSHPPSRTPPPHPLPPPSQALTHLLPRLTLLSYALPQRSTRSSLRNLSLPPRPQPSPNSRPRNPPRRRQQQQPPEHRHRTPPRKPPKIKPHNPPNSSSR